MSMHKPLIVAHRGDTTSAPENTLTAFSGAIEAGADAIEFDVHESSDGEIFVYHDLYLGRTSEGSEYVSALTGAQLKQIDVGSWYKQTFFAERVPFLAEVLDLGRSKVRFEIDLKEPFGSLADKVIKIVMDQGLKDQVEITSGHLTQLCRIRDRYPKIELGTWFNPFPGWMQRTEGFAQICACAQDIGLNVVHLHESIIEHDFVGTIKRNGWIAYGANLNSTLAISRAVDASIDRFSTSHLTEAVGFVNQNVA